MAGSSGVGHYKGASCLELLSGSRIKAFHTVIRKKQLGTRVSPSPSPSPFASTLFFWPQEPGITSLASPNESWDYPNLASVKLPLNVRLRLKIAPAAWPGSSVLPATCRPSMTSQPAGAIFSLNLTFKESFSLSKTALTHDIED